MNTGMLGGFNNVQSTLCQGFAGVNTAINGIGTQLASCCCETGRAIERGFAETNYNLATQACDTRRAIADSTREILDFLTQDKIAALTAENQSLKFAASQAA